MEVVEQQLRQRLWQDAETNAWLEAQLPALEAGTVAPFAIADLLRERSGALLTAAVHLRKKGPLPETNR